MFAFSGAHRTGKTTLAKEVAEAMGIHYHDASVSKIAREAGINAVGDLSLGERIKVQEIILEKFIEAIQAAPRPAICDRSPLDMVGYMLGEVTMHNTPVEFQQQIQDYVDKCIEATVMHFDLILMVRPLDKYEVTEKSPPMNEPYQSLIQMIIEGAAQSSDFLATGVICSTDRKERIELACTAFADRLAFLQSELKNCRVH